MENKKTQNIIIGLFLFAAGFIFFNGALFPGKVLFGTDLFTIYLPFKLFAQEMFQKFHDLPLWMPHIFFGIPLISSSSLLYYYPTDLIFMFLPFPLQFTYTADLIIHLLAAFFGMFLFLRQFSVRREAAFFSAMAFTISGFMLSYIFVGHWNNIKAGALIPFIFYFTAAGFDKKKLLPFLNAAIFMALQILATGMQIMAYTYIGAALLAVYKILIEPENKTNRIKPFILFCIGTAAIFIFSSLQLVPSIPYTDYSWRGNFSYNDFISWSLHPAEAITLLLPQFFGLMGSNYFGKMPLNLTTYYFGIITFLLIPFAFCDKKQLKFSLFLSFCSVFFLVLSFGGFTPLYRLFYYLPVFKQFRNPSRFLYVFTFFMTALAGLGLNNIFICREKSRGKLFKIIFYISVVVGVVSIILLFTLPSLSSTVSSMYMTAKSAAIQPQALYEITNGIKQDMLYFITVSLASIALLYIFISGRIKAAMTAALVLCIFNLADMHRIDSKFIKYEDYASIIAPSDNVTAVIKQDNDIFRTQDFSFAWQPNRGIYYGIEELKGIHGLIPAKYIEMERAGLFNMLAADSYFNIKYMVFSEAISVPGLEKVSPGPVIVYKNNTAAPRFDFTDRVIKFTTPEQVLSFMKNGNFDFKAALVSEDFDLKTTTEPLSYKIGLKKYSPNEISMTVEAGKDGLLVIKNANYGQWKVKVDKKHGKIYNVDYDFMGVFLNKGTHEVELYYSKNEFFSGLIITLLGLIFYAGVYIWEKKKKKAEK
jgi:hypothetical protein